MENNNLSTEYESLKIDLIFEPVKKLFEFYILGFAFVGQFDFQKIFLQHHPELESFLDRYNQEVNLRKDGSSVKSETKPYWISLGRVMVIALFNILESSEYQNILSREEMFEFARQLRNGAAHGNKFNILHALPNPIKWRNKIIDNSLHGKSVFPDFIDPTTLVILMADISNLISKNNE